MNALLYGQKILWHTGVLTYNQLVRSRVINGTKHYYAFTVESGHVLVFLVDKKKRQWMVKTDPKGNPEKLPEIS